MSLRKMIALFLVASSTLCLGSISGSLALSRLLSRADSVVVAKTRQIAVTGGEIVIKLVVQRAIKGNEVQASEIEATWTSASPQKLKAGHSSQIGRSGIWFLRKTQNGWAVLPLVTGYTDVSSLFIQIPEKALVAPASYSASANPKSKLLMEIDAAALADRVTGTLFGALRNLDSGFEVGSVRQVYSDLARSTEMNTKVIGLTWLLRGSDSHALTMLLAIVPEVLKPRW